MSNRVRCGSIVRGAPAIAMIVAIALVTSCEPKQLPTAASFRHRISADYNQATAWPDQPASFVPLADYGFSESIPTGSGVPIDSGWYINNNLSGYASHDTASNAPLTPPDVGHWSYPVGFSGGPPSMAIDPAPTKEVFFGVKWKVSSPWEDNGGGQSYISIVSDASDSWGALMMVKTSAGHQLAVQSPWASVPNTLLMPNVGSDTIALGAWHTVEWYLKYSTSPTSGDGILRWWLDGVLQGDYSNQNMPADTGFAEYRLEPRWDDGTKTEQDYEWYDQVRISKPGLVSDWPNEPAGFTLLSDYGFNDAIPTTNGAEVGSSGWYITDNSGPSGCGGTRGNATQLTNRTDAPFSPPNVGQWSYPIGFNAGCAPATMYTDFSPTREFYIGAWWEPSNPWQTHPSGVNKILFFYSDSGDVLLDMHNTGSTPPYELRAVSEYSSYVDAALEPNVREDSVALGVWHRVEFYGKWSTTSTSGDGIMRWWLDGNLQGDYENLNFPAPDRGMIEAQFSPTWGGVGGTKTENDYYWYDHVHLSRR